MLEQTKRISFRISSVLSSVRWSRSREPDLYTGSDQIVPTPTGFATLLTAILMFFLMVNPWLRTAESWQIRCQPSYPVSSSASHNTGTTRLRDLGIQMYKKPFAVNSVLELVRFWPAPGVFFTGSGSSSYKKKAFNHLNKICTYIQHTGTMFFTRNNSFSFKY